LHACNERLAELDAQLRAKTADEEKGRVVVVSLRKELDSERLVGRKRHEKVQQLEEINERFLYDIKNLRLRLSDYDTNAEDKSKLSEELFASQKTIGSLEEELYKISEEYQYHSSKYVYTLEDVENAIRELKEHDDRVKEEEMARLIQELDQNNSLNRQNMEKELLTLYNENEKLRVNLHKANEQALEMQLEMAELDSLRDKAKRLEKDRSVLERRVAELTDELNSSREDVRRLEIRFNESIRSQENKGSENLVLLQRYEEMSKRYQ
jgi:chromosome segregation ATPase